MNLPDHTVSVINNRPAPQPGLEVRARVYDFEGRLRWSKSEELSAPPEAFREAFSIPDLPGATAVSFVKLELKDARGRLVSDNFYWLAGREADGLKLLQELPPVGLKTRHRIERRGRETLVRVTVSNPADQVAFFIQLAVTRGRRGEEVLPVLWSDNYFSLLPGESRDVMATLATADLRGASPFLEAGGWNIETDYGCAGLGLSNPTPGVGEEIVVTASISDTFLDGSRVTLLLDGKPVASKWAWARQGRTDAVRFTLPPLAPGDHRIQVGSRTAAVTAR